MTLSSTGQSWIVTELLKLGELERSFAASAKARALSPPEPELAVLYHEISDQDEKHATQLETIAIRYGHTPSRPTGGGVSEALGRLKDKVAEIGTSSMDLVRHDLAAKSHIIHEQSAWVHALECLEDAAGAGELSKILKEEQTHHDALLQLLLKMLEHQVVRETAAEVVA